MCWYTLHFSLTVTAAQKKTLMSRILSINLSPRPRTNVYTAPAGQTKANWARKHKACSLLSGSPLISPALSHTRLTDGRSVCVFHLFPSRTRPAEDGRCDAVQPRVIRFLLPSLAHISLLSLPLTWALFRSCHEHSPSAECVCVCDPLLTWANRPVLCGTKSQPDPDNMAHPCGWLFINSDVSDGTVVCAWIQSHLQPPWLSNKDRGDLHFLEPHGDHRPQQ